jgi:phage head maturation protease
MTWQQRSSAQPLEFTRAFLDVDVDVNRKQGRVTGLVVPYLKPTPIMELREDGGLIEYQEQFAPGSMERAAKAPNRVMLQFTHSDALDHQLGYGVSFRDSDQEQGCVGEFQVYKTNRDLALEMLESSHRGLSVTFASIRPLGGLEQQGELVTRLAVMCRAVAAVTDPAYETAGVMAVRAQADVDAQVAAEQQRQDAELAGALQFLRDSGQDLSEAQQAWLADRGITLKDPAR